MALQKVSIVSNPVPGAFCFLSILLVLFSCKQNFKADILIQNVSIIDVESGAVITNKDVLINGNKISKIISHASAGINAETIINGSSKYLIPGLWDMHEHIVNQKWYVPQLPILRANGITGFREMFGDLKTADSIRLQMERDSLPYFRFVASGHILDGKKPFWEYSVSVSSPYRAVEVVDSLKNSKADFIKVYSLLRPDIFYAIANQCKKERIPFAGHVPYTVRLTEASNAGMASMEHLYGFLTEACSQADSATALMERLLNAIEGETNEDRKKISLLYNSLVLNNFSKEKMKLIAGILKRNKTHIVPTLVTLRGKYFSNDTSFTKDGRLKYMSDETLEFWKQSTASALKNNSEIDWQNMRKRWQLEQEIMRILIAEGVPLMAGTDADNPYAFPGFSLHDELALFVEYGMQPIDALRSATLTPAAFLNLAEWLGSIKEGKLADLVLLDANPLENIKNTTSVNSVIANGKLYSKKYVDAVLGK